VGLGGEAAEVQPEPPAHFPALELSELLEQAGAPGRFDDDTLVLDADGDFRPL